MEVVIIPFLNKAKQGSNDGGVIAKTSIGGSHQEKQKSLSSDALESCALDLIHAVHAKDVVKAAEAMQSAFLILESMPHEENEENKSSPSPHTYDSQNIKAAQE